MSDIFDDLAHMFADNGFIDKCDKTLVASAIRTHMTRYIIARHAVDNSGYAVHHINGNPRDHRPENLTLVRIEK